MEKAPPHIFKRRIHYHDLYLRLIISLISAHWIVSFGEKETFFELLLMPDYYRALLFSALIAFVIASMIRMVTRWLDKRFDWQEKMVHRVLLQPLLGVGGMAIVAFILATIYFAIHGMNILDTPYLLLDFPLIVLMLMIFNLYYFVYYVYVSWNQDKNGGNEKQYKNVFIILKGAKHIPVKADDIAYFHRSNEENFLRTTEGTDHVLNDALDQIEKKLDPGLFFRANRRFLTSFAACERFETIENDKLELFVIPLFKERIIISQKRVPGFKAWIGR